ncbi:DUF6531 domain-containing protein [Paraburkholderia hayleyella]|uniref:DUF6531 domain-containing protein n=1 Tax=Paraburkholderia hayleyella TaxID=2152889 RepID=UPI00129284E5|nr:DUF6531 domain-containing protein [Paraburkholderia hayleyella]
MSRRRSHFVSAASNPFSFTFSLPLLAQLLLAFALLLSVTPVQADCFDLYAQSGARPGTASCPSDVASNTPGGMGHYACLNDLAAIHRYCRTPSPVLPETSCPIADPVYPGTGVTTLEETDYATGDEPPVVFQRQYRSAALRPGTSSSGAGSAFGAGWSHNWQRRLDLAASSSAAPRITAWRDNGMPVTFSPSAGLWRLTRGTGWLLARSGNDWTLTNARTGNTETYSPHGVLRSVRTVNAVITELSYSDAQTPGNIAPVPGLLTGIDHYQLQRRFAASFRLAYDAQQRLVQMTRPDGGITRYGYDSNGNLNAVTWPDGTIRRYVYDDPRFVSALTGVIDETGSRTATWTYDAEGRAIAVSHPDSTRNVQFAYGEGRTTVTRSQGSTTLDFSAAGGVLRPDGSREARLTWDAAGNLGSRSTGEGRRIDYTYDSANRPVQVVRHDTSGTTTTRVRYADALGLRPAAVAEPGMIRALVYDDSGSLTGVSEQPTTDPTGASGFAATASGTAQTYGMAYDRLNQPVSMTRYEQGVPTGRWDLRWDMNGNLRLLAGGPDNAVLEIGRDDAHRVNWISAGDFSVTPVYDLRGRLVQFGYSERYVAQGVQTWRKLEVTYRYAADGRVTERHATVRVGRGAPVALSQAETDGWLDNYEAGVVPAGPQAGWGPVADARSLHAATGGAAAGAGPPQEAGLEPVCVECMLLPHPVLKLAPRVYGFMRGYLAGLRRGRSRLRLRGSSARLPCSTSQR